MKIRPSLKSGRMMTMNDSMKKLLELCAITDVPRYREPGTGAELLHNGRYYVELVEKVEARGESERINDLISLILAEALQPAARLAYGNGGSAAINQLLEAKWNNGGEEYWRGLLRLFRDALSPIGLEPEQEEKLIASFDEFPRLFSELLAAEAARIRLVPVENLGEVAGILAEMYREGNHAQQVRGN
jgi:hypothetical protein